MDAVNIAPVMIVSVVNGGGGGRLDIQIIYILCFTLIFSLFVFVIEMVRITIYYIWCGFRTISLAKSVT